MHRRDLLRFGAATAALALARRARAEVVDPRTFVRVFSGVSAGAAAAPGTQLGTRADGTHDYVRLVGDLGAHDTHVFSSDNPNARFTVWAMISEPPKDTWPYLLFDNEVRAASSTGSDGTGHTATFEVGPDLAKLLASFTGVALQLRTPLDADLGYAWSAPPAARKGDPVRVRLRVTNSGTRVVRFAVGGRNRGARDNRFSFEVRKDGRELPLKDEPDFGGLMTSQRLTTGAHVDVEADLRGWIDAPGVYDVDCEYQGEIYPDTDDLGRWPEHAAELWDIAPRGSLRVIIP
jgi:hypothetical protein